jgi:DNA-binding XRE family transcriptional regulator
MNNLRTVRTLKRVSQWELSKQTSIPQSRISLIENNLVNAKTEEMVELAASLGFKVRDIDWTGQEER